MNEKIILTDIDGVVLNWETQFRLWMSDRGYNVVNNNQYDIHQLYDIAYHKAEQYCNDFNTSAYIIDLPEFRDAVTGISVLKEAGYRFIGITSIGDNHYTEKLRKINLEEKFGKDTFIEVHCINENKIPLLKSYTDISKFWIEDTPKNAEIGANLGYNTFLIDHLYNEYYKNDNIVRVNNWKEICDIILYTTW